MTLSRASTTTTTVVVTTVAGTASAGSDFQTKTQTLTFSPGTTSLVFQVAIVGDRTKEQTETFTVVLSSPTGGATIGTGTGTVTIVDNDGAMLAEAAAPAGTDAARLTADVLLPVVVQAQALWRAADPSADFTDFTIRIADLPGLQLGWTEGRTTTIDPTAAGWGWSTNGAPGRIDLLTVVLHELGRVLGLTTDDAGRFPVMAPTLAPGERLSLRAHVGVPLVVGGRERSVIVPIRAGAALSLVTAARPGWIAAHALPIRLLHLTRASTPKHKGRAK